MASPGSIRATDIHNNEKTSEEDQGSDYEEPKVSFGLKRKASTSLNEAKRKRSIEDQIIKERGLDPEDPKEKIKSLMFHVDALKAECIWKDNQIEKLKVELAEKAEEIKKLLATNSRYKSGLACIICTGYLANPCTVNCGHSFCYSCLREWLKTNKENSKCPSCRTEITTQPVLSYTLKNQVEASVEQLSPEEKEGVLETLEKEDQMYKQISDHWAGIFDQSIRPLLDEEDGVLRCPTCGWEVEDSICGNCNQHINIENRENRDDNSDDNNDSNDDDDSEIDNCNDTYDSDDSFIDDGSDISNLMGNNELHVIEDRDSPSSVTNDPTNGDAGDDGDLSPVEPYADESYVIDDNEDGPLSPHVNINRPFNTIVINDSSSELSEEQSKCDRIEENSNVIVISSDENGEEKSIHSNGSQLTSPLSTSSYEENHEVENYGAINPSSCESDEGSFRVGLNTRRSLDQDGESQVRTKSFAAVSSEVEYTEHDSDDYHLYLY